MDGNRPPDNGSDETGNCSEKNFAACKSEPVRQEHPYGHIHRACGNGCPEMHEITFKKPDLDRSCDRAKNDARDRSFYQHGIVKRGIGQFISQTKR